MMHLWIFVGFAISCVLTQYIGPGHTGAESLDRIFWVGYASVMCWWLAK